MYRVVVAQKPYSSWSLRGWLLLTAFGLPFREITVRMYNPEFDRMKVERAPARTVPILEWDEGGETHRIWDTMAMAETLAERHPQAGIWPSDPWDRAVARTLAAEMHSGFLALRSFCPMNLHRHNDPHPNPEPAVAEDVDRAANLWEWAKSQTGGPWLGGAKFSAVDVFYAPLASRLESYALTDARTQYYVAQLLSHPSIQEWMAAAREDPERIALYEELS